MPKPLLKNFYKSKQNPVVESNNQEHVLPAETAQEPTTPQKSEVVRNNNQDDPRKRLLKKLHQKNTEVAENLGGQPDDTPASEEGRVNFEASYINESKINLGTIKDVTPEDVYSSDTPSMLTNLRGMYAENGGNVKEVDLYITQYLADNKNDDSAIQTFMSNFMHGIHENLYDTGKDTQAFGNTTEEILSRILAVPEGERLKGWVCSNIHDLGMRYLHNAGYESAVVSSKSPYGAGHAILIYKSANGKYNFVNYGTVHEVEAATMKEAVAMLQSSDSGIMSNGTICFVDENNSYCEYALNDDAVWGDKIDKSEKNNSMPAKFNLPQKSNISAAADYSNLGDFGARAEGNLVFGRNTKYSLNAGLGFQTNSNSQIFDSSRSFGAEAGIKGVHQGHGSSTYFGVDVVESYVSGKYAPIVNDDGTVRNQGAEYLTTYARGVAGIESDISVSKNTTLTNTAQASAEGYLVAGVTLGTSYNGDGRVAIEDCLRQTTRFNNNLTLENSLNGGLLIDMKKTSCDQEMGAQFGAKFNAGSSILAKPTNELSYGVGVDGYSVFTPASTEYGVGARTFLTYKPTCSDISFTGSAGAQFDYQKLHIGGMNELTEDRSSFSASLSAKHKKDTYSIGYNGKFNHINNSRNNSRIAFTYTRDF